MEKLLKILNIELDPELQPRAAMDGATVEEYTAVLQDEYRAGAWPFPPVQVVHDGQKYWLWDGFHRVQAAKNAGILRIPATIQSGDRAFALWRSLGANKTHGLRRSNADKRRATELALQTAPGRSDREIAFHVGVDHKTVGRVRAELGATGEIPQSTLRTGADGRTIDTARIGGYLYIWQIESKIREWLAQKETDQIAFLEEIKRRSADGQEIFRTVCKSITEKHRTGDVWQACNNVLDQLKQQQWKKQRAERIRAMICHCGQQALEPVGEMDALRCTACGQEWNSIASFNAITRDREQEHERNLQALEQAAGGPALARQVLELRETEQLLTEANALFRRIVETESAVGLRELIALLEDFELDRPGPTA